MVRARHACPAFYQKTQRESVRLAGVHPRRGSAGAVSGVGYATKLFSPFRVVETGKLRGVFGMKRVGPTPTSLDPETTPILVEAFDTAWNEILVEAFDAAWNDLCTAGCRAALGPEAPAARERLARRILAQAQRGVRDPIELSSDGVAHVLSAAARSRDADLRRAGAEPGERLHHAATTSARPPSTRGNWRAAPLRSRRPI